MSRIAVILCAGLALVGAMAPAAQAQDLTAIVESIDPPRADVRAFDLLAQGTVIELRQGDT